MSTQDLDQIIDRRHSGSIKFDAIYKELPEGTEVFPMWIADMDFPTPSFVLDAVRKRLEHPILGYSYPTEEYQDAICKWMQKRYGIMVEADEFCYTPGIVSGIYKVLQCLSDKGDGVLIFPPVYHPFSHVIQTSERRIVEVPLLLEDGRYYVDWELLEEKIKEAKLLIWCHPHNPGGRVWTQDEMIKLVNICQKHDVYIISDEIHADLSFPPQQHIPLSCVSPEAALRTISFMAPSKAFNMPGIVGSQLYVRQPELREKLFAYFENNGLNSGNACAFPAITAAYTQGEEWLDNTIRYIMGNVELVKTYLREQLPMLEMIEPEASFLVFINFSALGLSDDELEKFLVHEAGLLLNRGDSFGTGGSGWMRMNIGLPRPQLEKALNQLKAAIIKRQDKK